MGSRSNCSTTQGDAAGSEWNKSKHASRKFRFIFGGIQLCSDGFSIFSLIILASLSHIVSHPDAVLSAFGDWAKFSYPLAHDSVSSRTHSILPPGHKFTSAQTFSGGPLLIIESTSSSLARHFSWVGQNMHSISTLPKIMSKSKDLREVTTFLHIVQTWSGLGGDASALVTEASAEIWEKEILLTTISLEKMLSSAQLWESNLT